MDYLIDIIVAIITGAITLVGVIASNNKKQAVIEEKITQLTKAVDKHNNFAVRIPTLENDVKHIYHELDEIARKLP